MSKLLKKIRDFFAKSDIFLWLITIVAAIYSLLLINSLQRTSEYSYLNTQILAIIIGYILAIIVSIIDYKYYIKIWWVITILSFILIIVVFIFGRRVDGADDTAWIYIGPISIQPSEFLKVFFVITFTKHIQKLVEFDKLKSLIGILSLLVHAAIPVVILHLQGEDGTALVFIFMIIVMAFVAGVQIRYFLILLLITTASIPLIWNFFLSEEHKNRFKAIFDLDGSSTMDYGWQQYQGKVSIASGGINGFGLGNGKRVASGIVPEQENDFILTVAGEELGFIGCILILVILVAIMIKIIITATKSRDLEGKVICFGIFSMIATQSIINIGMVLGLLPVIGITLPFFSSGGTSTIAILLSIGLVQSVYYHKDEVEKPKGLLLNNKYKFMKNIHNEY